jgi:hypothetical protein
MNRLLVINFINQSWYTQVTEFLSQHPEFNKLIPIVALDEYPAGFNKNPHESDDDAPKNIFETIVYGVCHASLENAEGKKQYLIALEYFRNCSVFSDSMVFPESLIARKANTFQDLINRLLENNIVVNEMKYEHLYIADQVRGIGDSIIDLVNLLYAKVDDDCVIPITDSYFIKGIEMMYNIQNPTESQIKEITDTWQNKKVGVMFIIQYAHYSEFVKE